MIFFSAQSSTRTLVDRLREQFIISFPDKSVFLKLSLSVPKLSNIQPKKVIIIKRNTRVKIEKNIFLRKRKDGWVFFILEI